MGSDAVLEDVDVTVDEVVSINVAYAVPVVSTVKCVMSVSELGVVLVCAPLGDIVSLTAVNAKLVLDTADKVVSFIVPDVVLKGST